MYVKNKKLMPALLQEISQIVGPLSLEMESHGYHVSEPNKLSILKSQ